MKYLERFNENSNNDELKRSGRLLSQKQRNNFEIFEADAKYPVIIFTDIVNSSKLWQKNSKLMEDNLKNHFKLIDSISKKHNGWIVKSIGDAFMLYFEPGEKALMNAILFTNELVLNEPVYKLRIGLANGSVSYDTYEIQKFKLKDFFGNVVNAASRMESIISPINGFGLSLHTEDLNEDEINLLDELNLKYRKMNEEDITPTKLKGVDTKIVYQIGSIL